MPAMSTDSAAEGAEGVEPNKSLRRRLIITKLVVENFKSYAGEKVIGPFHKCFSAVVGPNGSGKSNVIDSIVFVFGFASRKLRQDKLSALIHSSEGQRDIESATVTIHFAYILDNESHPDEFTVCEGTDFTVSRSVFRNNSSVYRVDGKKVTKTQVVERLKSEGIDLNNCRFLILQGEVEHISLMKPKGAEHETGLLEYIEEIIGTDKYITDIDERQKELEVCNEERAQKLNRARVVEKEKNGLESSKLEAEAFLRAEHELVNAQAQRLQLEGAHHQTKLDKIGAKAEVFETEKGQLVQHAKEVEAQMKENEAKFKEENERYVQLKKEADESKKRFEACEKEKAKLKQETKHTKTRGKKVVASLQKERKQLDEKCRSIEMAEEDVVRLEKQISSLTTVQEKEEKILDGMHDKVKEETKDIRKKVEEKKKQLIPFRNNVSELDGKKGVLQNELNLLEEKSVAAEKEYNEAKQRRESAKEKFATSQETLEKNVEKLKALEKKESAAKEQFHQYEAEKSTLTESISRDRTALDEAREATNQSTSGNKQVYKALMTLASKGFGVRGRLGDLGTIDAKYDVAVSTAAGGSLDCVVVDTANDAQACLKLLKQKNLGRMTFIVLNQISSNSNPAFKAPGGALRLIDLIQPAEDQYRTAFYFAVRDTVVASDIEQGKKLCYSNRLRTVTLAGQLFEASGTLTGGRFVSRGKMRLASGKASSSNTNSLSPKQIAAIQQRLEASMDRLRQVNASITQLQDEMDAMNKMRSQLTKEAKTLKVDIEESRQLEKQLESRLPELEKRAKSADASKQDQTRMKQLRKEISAAETSLEEEKGKASTLENEICDLQNEILAVGGVEMKLQQQKVESAGEKIDQAQQSITQKQVQIKTLSKQVEKHNNTITKLETEEESLKQQIMELSEKKSKITAEQRELAEVHNTAKDNLDEMTDAIAEFQAQEETMKKTLHNLKSNQIKIETKIEDALKGSKELVHAIKVCEAEIEKLRQKKSRMEVPDELPPSQAKDKDEKEVEDEKREGQEDASEEMTEKEDDEMDTTSDDQQEHGDGDSSNGAPSSRASPISDLLLLTEEEMATTSMRDIDRKISKLQTLKESMSPNMAAINEYRQKEAEWTQRMKELDESTSLRDAKRKEFEDLRKQRLREFMVGFNIINPQLKKMYRMITLGGDAELEFVDSLDPFAEGLVFSVRPPKKSWKNISNLSGGEKTLSSLALVFALHTYKPTPLYFMDEIDAALDFKNVSIVAHYVKEQTKNAQFIIISLRNNMFELADRLVGIYKVANCTDTVSIDPRQFSMSSEPETRIEKDKERERATMTASAASSSCSSSQSVV